MCLVVYLGLDAALDGYSRPEDGGFGLQPDPEIVPPALADRKVIYSVTQYGDGKCGCSCELYHHHLPWEPRGPDSGTLEAYRFLREVVEKADRNGLKPGLFSSWSGEEQEPVAVEWELPVAALVPENNLFEDYEVTGGGRPPPSVFRIDQGRSGAEAEYL